MNFFNQFVSWVLKNRIMVLLFSILLFVYGSFVTLNSPVDILPDLNRPTVTIFSEAEGFATEEVETLVSRPIENVMNGATGVERTRSVSAAGLSLVFIEFSWDQDIYIARQIVSEKLQAISMPEGVESQLGPISSIMGEIQLVGFSSKSGKTSPRELRNLADWTIKQKLQTVAGVASVTVLGGEIEEYQVKVDPTKLANVQMTIAELEEKLVGISENKSGGFLTTDTLEYPVRIIGRTTDIETLQNTVVGQHEGTPIFLKDVAEVEVGSQLTPRGDAAINGKPGVLLSITKQPGANTLELTQRIDAALEEMQDSLGEDIELHADLFKQEKFISTGIDNLTENIRDAAILVAIILILFLGHWRAVGITLFALPFSFVITILILRWFGIDINVMTLGGLAVAVGELTDDAVVDVENTIRWFREQKKKAVPLSIFQTVLHASSEVRGSIVFSTVLIVLVFLPLVALGNIEGRLLAPLAISYITALIASTIVAMTVTAVMCYYLIPNSKLVEREHETLTARFFQWLAKPIIIWNIRHPMVGVGIACIATILTVILVAQAGKEFLPPFNEGSLTIGVTLPPGSSLDRSKDISTNIEKAIMGSEGVLSVARRTGRAEEDEHANSINVSEFEVDIDIERGKNIIIQDIKANLAKTELGNANVSIGQPISHRIEHILSGVRAPLVIKIFGPDLDALELYGNQIRDILATIPGTLNPVVEQEVNVPQIVITPLRDRIAQYGFTFDDFTETLEVALGGKEIGKILDNNKTFRFQLRLNERSTNDPERIGQLLLKTPLGISVPLSAVADVRMAEGRNSISHDNGQRRLVISSGIFNGDSVTIIETLKKKVAESIELPQEYFISYEGTYKSQQESSQTLMLYAFLSFLGVIGALYYKFRSFSFVFQVLINVPVTYLGAMIAIALTGNVISLASLVGLISLLGLAARNGILLIEHWLYKAVEEGEPFGEELIVNGSLNRLTPMLITSLSAVLALLPLLLAPDKPGLEMLYPISVTIFGGVLASTIVEIIIRPGMFKLFGKKPLEKAVQRNMEKIKD